MCMDFRIAGQSQSWWKSPLLVSVCFGADALMPGMMDTVFNLGLSDKANERVIPQNGWKGKVHGKSYKTVTYTT